MVDSVMTYIGDRNFYLEIAKGNVPGHDLVHKFGRNQGIPNGSWEVINTVGTAGLAPLGIHLQTAATMRVKAGGDAADTAAGNNAREITIEGLDSNWDEVSEAVATAGAGASAATSASFIRVNRAYVSSVGTYGESNNANVTIEDSGGAADMILISNSLGQTQDAQYTIPRLRYGFLTRVKFSVDAASAASHVNFIVWRRGNANDTSAPMVGGSARMLYWADGVTEHYEHIFHQPIRLDPYTDIWIEAIGNSGTAAVTADFDIILVDDDYVT
jgi:hypothetical protein